MVALGAPVTPDVWAGEEPEDHKLLDKIFLWEFGYLQEHQLRKAQTLFDITQDLILDQDFEILNVPTIE